MTVVPYTCPHKRKVRDMGIEPGQTLYAIKIDGLYFIWSYSDRDMAEFMDKKLVHGPEDSTDMDLNWRSSTDQLVPTDRKR